MSKALQYAFLLLKYRLRSEHELRQRLKRRGFSEQDIKEVLIYLKEKSLINDHEFARIWVESRIKKPLGIHRLKQELKIKGIDKDIIEQIMESVGSRYSEGEIIKELVSRRWDKLKHIPLDKAKRRLFLYLLYRGFSSDRIQEAINEL